MGLQLTSLRTDVEQSHTTITADGKALGIDSAEVAPVATPDICNYRTLELEGDYMQVRVAQP